MPLPDESNALPKDAPPKDGPVKDLSANDARGDYVSPRDYRRPSERIFRRSRAAQQRRAAKSKSEFKFIAALLQLSVLVALVLVVVGVYAQRAMQGNAPDMSNLSGWAQPAFLGASWLEIGAIALTILIAVIAYFRLRQKSLGKRR